VTALSTRRPPTSHGASSLGAVRERWARLRRGETGAVPVVVGMAVIWLFFQSQNANFLTARNLSNLVLQLGVVGILAIGVVLVLLAGEIDLSLGAVSGVCAGLLGVLLAQHGWPTWAALAAALVLGLAIGLLQGAIVVYVGVPSFVVTLGGFLAWGGVQLALLGSAGELRVQDSFVRSIANSYLPPAVAWTLAVLVVAWVTGAAWLRRRAWARAGLDAPPWRDVALPVAGVTVAGAVVVAYLDRYFGVPYLLVLLLALTAGLGWVTGRTVFGRHLYAIGGGAEAARRAGVSVNRTRFAVFAIAAVLAALAGVVSVSREFSVSTGTGGGTLLLEAIAAAVIGGTSLFGGRGRTYHALLGALVITSVENGLDLLGKPSSAKDVATGAILVLAVCLDAISRRRRAAAGT
jgi:D-xylose transport system permease protein